MQTTTLEQSKKLRSIGWKQGTTEKVWVERFPIFNDKDRVANREELKINLDNSILSDEAKALINFCDAPTLSEFMAVPLGECAIEMCASMTYETLEPSHMHYRARTFSKKGDDVWKDGTDPTALYCDALIHLVEKGIVIL